MKQSQFSALLKGALKLFHLRWNICGLVLVAFIGSGCATSQDQSLIITAEQFDAVAAAGPDDELPLRGQVERGAPVIIVDSPDSDIEVITPFSVQMRFVTSDGATIDVDTLKIKYGLFNLTKEVRKRMTVTTSGIEGLIDAVKPGKYKLTFSIKDDQQRTGKKAVIFRVAN